MYIMTSTELRAAFVYGKKDSRHARTNANKLDNKIIRFTHFYTRTFYCCYLVSDTAKLNPVVDITFNYLIVT